MRNFRRLVLGLVLVSLSGCYDATITVDYDELVTRQGTHYLKFTKEPFSGKTTGAYQGTLQDGRWEGVLSIYREDGTLHFEVPHKKGIRHGEYRSWCKNGNPELVRQYVDGKKDGWQKVFWCNGNLSSEMLFSAGKIQGKEITGYHPNGKLRLKFVLKNGLMEGKAALFHQNGNLQQEALWQEDFLNGACRGYEDNGLLQYEVLFTSGQPSEYKLGDPSENIFNGYALPIDMTNRSIEVERLVKKCGVSRLRFEEK